MDEKNIPALNNLAISLQHEKDPRALDYAEKANALAPNNASIMDTLGWILVEQRDTKRGIPILQKAITLAPDLSELRYHLAVALSRTGDHAEARKELKQLLASGENFSNREEANTLLKKIQ